MTARTCPVCADTFHPDPRHKSQEDCPECRAWASRRLFGLALDREVWRTAKRLLHASCMVKRGALRAHAYEAKPVDPRATIRVARMEAGQ